MAQLSPEELTLLQSTFFFSGTDPALAAAAAADPRCTLLISPRGQVVYDPIHFRRCLGVVLAGGVRVSKGDMLVSHLTPGELFGAAALFNDRTDYAATLTACAPSRLLLFPQQQVLELLGSSPQLARNYIRYLSGRIRFLERRLDHLAAGSAREKLSEYLLELSRSGLSSVPDRSATALASRLNVSRASLYRALDGLISSGAIAREGRTIHILAPAKLRGDVKGTDPL